MLQQQMEQLKNKLGQTRTNMGGIFSAKQKTVGLQKQIKILENRLEKQFIKYNEVGMLTGTVSEAAVSLLEFTSCLSVCQQCLLETQRRGQGIQNI